MLKEYQWTEPHSRDDTSAQQWGSYQRHRADVTPQAPTSIPMNAGLGAVPRSTIRFEESNLPRRNKPKLTPLETVLERSGAALHASDNL